MNSTPQASTLKVVCDKLETPYLEYALIMALGGGFVAETDNSGEVFLRVRIPEYPELNSWFGRVHPSWRGLHGDDIFNPLTNWRHCGPIVASRLESSFKDDPRFTANPCITAKATFPKKIYASPYDRSSTGPDLQTALYRAIIKAHFGPDLEIPTDIIDKHYAA